MLTIRLYRVAKWLGWRVLRPLHLKDRWGFNLGEDLHDWATMRTFIYLEKMRKLSGFGPTEQVQGPPTATTTSTATTKTWTVVSSTTPGVTCG